MAPIYISTPFIDIYIRGISESDIEWDYADSPNEGEIRLGKFRIMYTKHKYVRGTPFHFELARW